MPASKSGGCLCPWLGIRAVAWEGSHQVQAASRCLCASAHGASPQVHGSPQSTSAFLLGWGGSSPGVPSASFWAGNLLLGIRQGAPPGLKDVGGVSGQSVREELRVQGRGHLEEAGPGDPTLLLTRKPPAFCLAGLGTHPGACLLAWYPW